MSNTLKFELKKEVKLDKNFKQIGDLETSLYISCDEISCWIAYVNNFSDAVEMIQPEKLEELFSKSLSEVETEIIFNILEYLKKYYFYDLEFKYEGNV